MCVNRAWVKKKNTATMITAINQVCIEWGGWANF